MLLLLRNILFSLSVVLLLGHNTVPHVHHCGRTGIHTQDLLHQLGDLFGADLGEGHLEHIGQPDQMGGKAAPLYLATLPPAGDCPLPMPVSAAPAASLPMPHSGRVSQLAGHGNASGLRGPPAQGFC